MDASVNDHENEQRSVLSEKYRFVWLATGFSIALLTWGDAKSHPGSHPTKGFHHPDGSGGVMICQSEADCHDRMAEFKTSTGVCPQGFHKTQTQGPEKVGDSYWWVKTQGQCLDNGVPVGTHFGWTWVWWINGMPPACNNGDDAPMCPHDGQQFMLEAPEPPEGCLAPNKPSPTNESNPCNPATGTKSQVELDYQSPAAGGLSFARFYNSKGAYNTASDSATGWRHSYSRRIDEAPDQKPNVLFSKPANQSKLYATASDACTTGWSDIKRHGLEWRPVYRNRYFCERQRLQDLCRWVNGRALPRSFWYSVGRILCGGEYEDCHSAEWR